MSYETNCDERQVLEFLPWARRFARTCAAKLPNHLDHDDLQSAGVLGYLRAASRYDASRGASFRGYCSVRIRGAVIDELRRWDWAPRSVHKNNRRITCVTIDLKEQLKREPTSGEVAAALGIEEADLAAYQTQSQPRQLVSFDEAPDGQGEDSLPLAERLADPHTARPDEALVSAENRRMVLRGLRNLPKSQATVIVLHYLQSVPLRDVAKILDVTPSRVSQIHHQALDRLQEACCRSGKGRFNGM